MKKLLLLCTILLFSIPAFTQWYTLTSGTELDLNSVHFADINTGYAVGYYGTILKTTNGGSTWTALSSGGSTESYFSVYFTDPLTGYVAGDKVFQNGVILKTIDGGLTWNTFNTNAKNLTSLFFTDANTGYAVGDTTILKTTNAGSTWTTLTSGTSSTLECVFFPVVDTGYIVGAAGEILKTTNAGVTWNDISIGGNRNLYSVHFTDANTGYAVGDNGLITRTVDGGISWSELTFGNYNHRSVFFTNSSTGHVVGWDSYVLKTTNGGYDWWPASGFVNRMLNSVFFTNTDTGYAVGAQGTIMKTTNGGGFFEGLTESQFKSNTLTISPNPASDWITILTPASAANGQLSIMNLNGMQFLSRQISERKPLIDISTLPNGVYIVRMTSDKTVDVVKFVKQ